MLFRSGGQQLHTSNAERHVVDGDVMFKQAIQGADVVYYSNHTGTGDTEEARLTMFRDMYLSLEYLQEVERFRSTFPVV